MRLVAFIIFLLFNHYCFSAKSYQYRHVSTEHGLSQSVVNQFFKDSKGFIWIGTQDGLNRFDGYRFKVLLSGKSGESLYIQGIAEDSNGNIWVGSQKGVYRYEPKTNKLFKVELKTEEPKNGFYVIGNKSRNIVIVSMKGMYRVTESKAYFISNQIKLSGHNLNRSFSVSPTDEIWKIKNDSILSKYSFVKNKITNYNIGNASGEKKLNTNSIYVDFFGFVWLGGQGCIRRFDSENKKMNCYYDSQPSNAPSTFIAISEDENNHLWTATSSDGIKLFNKITGVFDETITHQSDNKNSLTVNNLNNIFIVNNLVFVGINPFGFDIISKENNENKFYSFSNNSSKTMSSSSVRGLAADNDGFIWTGFDFGGVNKVDPNTGKFQHFNTNSGLPDNNIYDIIRDQKGTIWVGSQYGIACYNSEKEQFEQIDFDMPITTYSFLNLDANYLLACTDKGMYTINTTTKKYFTASRHEVVKGHVSYQDPISQKIYIADNLLGISEFTYEDGMLVFEKKRLENFRILSIIRDPEKDLLWICTSEGLIKYNPEAQKIIRHYQLKDGLPHEYLYAILPDKNGQFWISSNTGLIRFDPIREKFTEYNAISKREYNTRAALSGPNGLLFFGSVSGLDQINPNSRQLEAQTRRTVITDIVYRTKTMQVYRHKTDSKTIEIPSNTHNIDIYFSNFDYLNGDKSTFRYMLKNYDLDTLITENNNYARYTNLAPGNYEFLTQTSFQSSEWSSPITRLKIVVKPHLWQMPIAIMLFLSVLSIICFYFILDYLDLLKRNKVKTKYATQYDELRISQELSDSLGSKIFGMKILGQIALSQQSQVSANKYIHKMIDNCKEIIDRLSESIWINDQNQNTFESLWIYLQKNASLVLKETPVAYEFEYDNELKNMTIPSSRRHQLLEFNKSLYIEIASLSDNSSVTIKHSTLEFNMIITLTNFNYSLIEEKIESILRALSGRSVTSNPNQLLIEIPLLEKDSQ